MMNEQLEGMMEGEWAVVGKKVGWKYQRTIVNNAVQCMKNDCSGY